MFAGFLGVGPGFLLMPTLVLLGYTARIAAATNALVVTLPSFSAFGAYWSTARLALLGTTAVTSIVGAQLGAAFMARRVRSRTLEVIFAGLLVTLAVQRAYLLLRAGSISRSCSGAVAVEAGPLLPGRNDVRGLSKFP
ncbi:MAG: sulfite exporter TauE/SafE family protein [Armatimonadota bacterium]|nr:sulfite exporter TauE/SafE family protein [Armatimonadota bacterium]